MEQNFVQLLLADDWERHGFAAGDAFEEPEVAFAVTPATGGRHAVFKHFHEILIEHLGFVITGVAHGLLLAETFELIEWVVQLAVAVAHFSAGDDWVEALDYARVGIAGFGEGAELDGLVDQPERPGRFFADEFPKVIEQAGVSQVGKVEHYAVVAQDALHLGAVGIENVDAEFVAEQVGVAAG